MKRILIKVGAVLFVVAGLVAVLWPVSNWRMYDANWQPLAMTEAEGYCAGYLLGESNFNNSQDKEGMAACIARNESMENETPQIGRVVKAFCTGLAITAGMEPNACLDIIEGYEIWPLQYGGYTWEWNETNPRPEVVQSDISNAPRRAGRNENDRNDTGRGFE